MIDKPNTFICISCHKEEQPLFVDWGEYIKDSELKEKMPKGWYFEGHVEMKLCGECLRKEKAASECQERQLRILRDSGLPSPLYKKTFENFVVSESLRGIYDRLRDNYDSLKKGYYMFGETGTGKTHLISAYLNQRAKMGTSFAFWKEPDFFDDVYNFQSETLIRAKNESILVIDDLGTSVCKDWRGEKLYEVIDFRCDSHKLTFFTSNLSPYHYREKLESMVQELGKKMVSRILELCDVYKFDGDEDWRLKNGN